MCWEVGGCARGAPQAEWLAADLAGQPALCTLTYWHFSRFSSALQGRSDVVQRLWEILYEAGAEIVLAGHDPVYERFGSQDAQGQPDPWAPSIHRRDRGRKPLRVRCSIAEKRGPRVGDLRGARADPLCESLRVGVCPGGGGVVHRPW